MWAYRLHDIVVSVFLCRHKSYIGAPHVVFTRASLKETTLTVAAAAIKLVIH